MPSTYAHRRFGADVLALLPDGLRATLEQHRELYDIGLHGPDLMFYYKALQSNPVNRLGNTMHEQKGEVFFTRARTVVENAPDKDAALAYALGFVCHFALDSTCHPYVEAYVRESGVGHCEIETEFDNALMREDGLDPIKFFTASHIKPSRERAEVIAPFYEGVTVDETLAAMKGMITVHHFLQAANPVKRWVVLTGMRVAGKYEFMHGLVANPQPNPKCVESRWGQSISIRLGRTEKVCCPQDVGNSAGNHFDLFDILLLIERGIHGNGKCESKTVFEMGGGKRTAAD